MSDHVLMNLLNELRKKDKILGEPLILSLFRNEFNKFNNTRTWMLDSIYHMTFKLIIKNRILGEKTSRGFDVFTQRYSGRHHVTLWSL